MSNGNCGSATHPIGAGVPGTPYPTTAPSLITPPGLLKNPNPEIDYPGKQEWEPEYREVFSKSILRQRFQEFKGGKYTKRYIETYLEFMVLSGMVNNLDYLEFKRTLVEE